MTSPNPQRSSERAVTKSEKSLQLGYGYIDSADVHEAGDDNKHIVEVQPFGKNTTFLAQVAVTAEGDVNMPPQSSEDVPVLYTTRTGDIPVVISLIYDTDATVPPYEPGERRVGHALTDANIYFDKDGAVTLESDGGATVTLQADGTVSINGGTQGAIYDISYTTDADGHVTSLSPERRDDILI